MGRSPEEPDQHKRRPGGQGRPGSEEGWPVHGDDWSDNGADWPENHSAGLDDRAPGTDPEKPVEVWPEPDDEQPPGPGGGSPDESRPSEPGTSAATGPGATDERRPGADTRPPASGSGVPARPVSAARPGTGTRPATVAPPTTVSRPVIAGRPATVARPAVAAQPAAAARSGDSPAPGDRPGEADVSRSSEDTATPRPAAAVVEGDGHAHQDNPGGGSRPPGDDLVADLVVDGARVAVSLVGATGDGPGVAYGWRSAGQAPPVAALPVALGDQDGRCLHLDLGRCPDVLTVAGSLPDCEKYALRLVRQVLANGHGVAVIGDELFGDALPAGCRRVATMADVRELDSPGIVISGSLTGPDVAAARISRASGGPTPVIIGEVARSRWTLRVNPA